MFFTPPEGPTNSFFQEERKKKKQIGLKLAFNPALQVADRFSPTFQIPCLQSHGVVWVQFGPALGSILNSFGVIA